MASKLTGIAFFARSTRVMRWAAARGALAVALLLVAGPLVLAQSTPAPPERPSGSPEQTGAAREGRESGDGDATKDETEVNRVVPSRQLSALRAGLEQQLKDLPPGKKADAIRRLLEQLSNAPQASDAKTANRESPSREGPVSKVAPPPRTTVERMLAEIEFRVVLQQYEHLLVRLRDLQIERALLQAEGLAEADLRVQQARIDARATILDQLRGQVALQIGEMHDAMRALGFDGGMVIPAERAVEAPASIGGICLDDATGEPLAGVQVVVQRQSANATTGESKSESFAVSKSDLQGRFNIAEQSEQLKRENVSLRLVFIKPGYLRSELTIDRSTPGLSNLQHRMKRGSSNTNRP